MIRWHQQYPGGRMVIMLGQVEVGAVFPPVGHPQDRNPWAWRLWIGGHLSPPNGRAKTEQAAKNALTAALLDWLRAAGLQMESAHG